MADVGIFPHRNGTAISYGKSFPTRESAMRVGPATLSFHCALMLRSSLAPVTLRCYCKETNGIRMNSNWPEMAKAYPDAGAYPVGAPKTRPFYWDIAKAYQAERERKWGKDPKKVVKKILETSQVPYWLPEQSAKAPCKITVCFPFGVAFSCSSATLQEVDEATSRPISLKPE